MADDQSFNLAGLIVEPVSWMREHPRKALQFGLFASLSVGILASVLGNVVWSSMSEHPSEVVRAEDFRQKVSVLREEAEDHRQELLTAAKARDLEITQLRERITGFESVQKQTDGLDMDVRLINQQVLVDLPELKSRLAALETWVIQLQARADSVNERFLALGAGGNYSASLLGKLESNGVELQRTRGDVRELEVDVTGLKKQVASLDGSKILGGEIREIRGDLEELGRDLDGLDRRLASQETASLASESSQESPPAETSKDPAGDTESLSARQDSGREKESSKRHSLPPDPRICDRPVDPGVARSEANRPQRADRRRDPRLRLISRGHREAQLTLCLTVGDDGAVQGVRILESQGIHPADTEAFAQATLRWRFVPARWQGQDVAWHYQFRVLVKP